jgi:tight adherence protein B
VSPVMVILAFCAGFFLIFAINYALADVADAHRQRYKMRLEQELRRRQTELARASVADRDLAMAAAVGMADLVPRRTLYQRLRDLLNESGVAMRPDQLFMACGALGLLTFLPCALIGQHWLLGGLLGVAASPLPFAYVAFLRKQRRNKLLSQLPEAFELMSRTLRSGQTMAQALQSVADEGASPIAEEFGYCYEQQNLGLTAEAAMRELAVRTGLLELKIFVMAVMIHRQTGGNMAELLDKLSKVIRERAKIRGAVKALTAEGAMQAYILIALPPGMLAIMLTMNRDYAMLLFEYYWLLVAAGTSMLFGWLWMRKIVNFDF